MSLLPTAIVDTHHHLWDLSAGHYPWLQEDYDAERFILGPYRALCKDYLPADLRHDIGALRVVATVHVEAERERTQAEAETSWLAGVAQAHGLPTAIVAWVDLLAEDVEARLDAQCRCPLVRGVRFKPVVARDARGDVAGQPGALQDGRWRRGLQALADRGLVWELRVPFWHLEEAAEVVSMVPGLTVVLQHLGLPWDRSTAGLNAWIRGLQALAVLPRVHMKLSELGLRDQPWRLADNAPLLHTALQVFGPRRCLFGSNFPVAGLRIGYGALVDAMSQVLAGLPLADQCAIWHDNAVALYALRTTPDL